MVILKKNAQNTYENSTLFATLHLDKRVICDRIMLSNQKGTFIMETTIQQQSAQKLLDAAKNLVKKAHVSTPSQRANFIEAKIAFGKEFSNIPDEDKREVVSQAKEISQNEGSSLLAQTAYDNIEYKYYEHILRTFMARINETIIQSGRSNAKNDIYQELCSLTERELEGVKELHERQKQSKKDFTRETFEDATLILDDALKALATAQQR